MPVIEKKLRALGAKKVFDGDMVYTLFDFKDKRLSKHESLLRLRQEGSRTRLTYKKLVSKVGAKISEEIETEIKDGAAMVQVLSALGLQPKKGYPLKKHRCSYVLGKVHFEFDTFKQIPTYLEIEAPTKKVLEQVARGLGFSRHDLLPWGTSEVFKHYGVLKDKSRTPRG